MGLPIWRAPSPEAHQAVKTKTDPTAPARSPIRRLANRHARASPSPRSPRLSDRDTAEPATRADDSVARAHALSRHTRRPPPPVPESRNYLRFGERDISWAQREHASRMSRMRSSDYRSSLNSDAPRLSASGESMLRNRDLPALTPNFAPAAASRRARNEHPTDWHRSDFRSRSPPHRYRRRSPSARESAVHGDLVDDSLDAQAVGFPPLRRVGRRTIADGPLPSSSLRESWSPGTSVDGLGDRERSLSPVDDHWSTMLSTVAPDPLAPTADSSFTSAAASASFSASQPSSRAGSSNSNSAASSRTHLTIPSRHHSPANDLSMRICDTSDSDTASDTEDEDMIVRPLQSSRHGLRHDLEDEPPRRDPSRYSRDVRDRAMRSTEYARRFYSLRSRPRSQSRDTPFSDQLDGIDERSHTSSELQALDRDFRDTSVLLEELSRRGHFSEGIWAAMGMTPPLGERVEQNERL